jgi:hypothetical protein
VKVGEPRCDAGTFCGTPLLRDAHAARHGPGDRGTQVRAVHRINIFVEYTALSMAHLSSEMGTKHAMVQEIEALRLGQSIE